MPCRACAADFEALMDQERRDAQSEYAANVRGDIHGPNGQAFWNDRRKRALELAVRILETCEHEE